MSTGDSRRRSLRKDGAETTAGVVSRTLRCRRGLVLATAVLLVAAAAGDTHTQAEVEALIEEVGRTPPDWWDSVPLEYPQTLDLTWKNVTDGIWDAQRNLGDYVFSVVDANESKFRSGARLLHYVLTVNKDDTAALKKTVAELGHVYGFLLEDYARAAFWLRKADAMPGSLNAEQRVQLAQCYWKLGSKQMALAELSRLRTFPLSTIRLYSEMGEIDRALRITAAVAREYPDIGHLAAGDVYRFHGRYQEAATAYQEVLSTTQGSREIDKSKKRARASLDAIRAFEALSLSAVPDGTYQGSSRGYSADVVVSVTVRDGRIESVDITSQRESRALAALVAVPRTIVERQGLKDVDAVTGATVTSEAVLNAAAKALAGAMP